MVIVPIWPVHAGRYMETGSSRLTMPSSTSVMKTEALTHLVADAM